MPEPGLSYTRPILSPLGTTERFDARMIPFHNNTDSQVFNMGIIGIPAVTFTNWPDDFIHSTGDDLWQVDPTQLERNAVVIAGTTWFLATAGAAEVPLLATHMYGRALERMSRDARIGMEMIEAGRPKGAAADPAAQAAMTAAYERAARLVREAARRERRALESVRLIGRSPAASVAALDALITQLPSDADAEKRLAAYYSAIGGTLPAAPPARKGGRRVASKAASEAPSQPARTASMVPVMIDSVKDFLALRGKVMRPAGLHPLMQYEALNYVDGKRSVSEIFAAVGAQADSAGAWYYGTVTLEDVEKLFDSAAKAGLVTLKPQM
jgi:hypothetical protein